MDQTKGTAPENSVGLRPMKKEDKDLLTCVDGGSMVAVVSQDEIMYVFLFRGDYQCFIHKIDAEEGRRKSFAPDERNRAMLKNLDSAADHLFEVLFDKNMNLMGVMVAAERGICDYLDSIGELKTEPVDFMEPYETKGEAQ